MSLVPWGGLAILQDTLFQPKFLPVCHVPSPVCLPHTHRCHHGEDTPALEDLTLSETQLAPKSRFWGTTPTWGHPTQHLTPHELGVVLWASRSGDTCPVNLGMSPAASWGCSRCEGSARTRQGWRYPPRWRMGTLWGGGTCPGRTWGHSGITHVSQHKMGTFQGFGSLSYSHHTSHLVGASHFAGSSSPSCPIPLAAAPYRIPCVGRRKIGLLSPWWFLCHHHHGDMHLSSLSTPFSEQK